MISIYEDHKYLIVNTHLDNLFKCNRKRQLEVLTHIIEMEKTLGEDVIITGDFNMYLTGDLKTFKNQNKLVDAVSKKLGSSYRKFNFKEPIDHIFVSESTIQIEQTEYDRKKYSDVYPSDHYPVICKIKRKK